MTPIRVGKPIELRDGRRTQFGMARRRSSPWPKRLVGLFAVALVFTAALTRSPKMDAGATEPPSALAAGPEEVTLASIAPAGEAVPLEDLDLEASEEEFDESVLEGLSGPDVIGQRPDTEVDLVVAVPEEPSPFRKITYTVGRQDTLYDILTSYGVSGREVHEVARAARGVFNFAYMRPGDLIKFELLRDPIELSSLTYPIRDNAHLYVVRDGDRFVAREEALETEKRLVAKSGSIASTLYDAGVEAGLDLALISRLADIFSWEIDFVRDIRTGDTFSVLYEERYRKDKYLGPGEILAASFTNNGRTLEAFAYPDENGETSYYTAQGRSLRKQFLRAPLEYTRISSYFSESRFHPVLKRTMPHLGVDFAAPIGTPVRAVGDGTITFAGWKGASGKFVKMRHNSVHESGYAHLSRIASGIHRGTKVKRGQVIGYVGATGRATGPHLHYAFYVNGRYRNPLKMRFAEGDPLPPKRMNAFLEEARTLRAAIGDPETRGILEARLIQQEDRKVR